MVELFAPEAPRTYRVRVYWRDGYWSFEVTGPVAPLREDGYLSREDARRAARAFIERYRRAVRKGTNG